MNKDFFKIESKINLLDILDILEISKDDFFSETDNSVLHPEKIYVEDFVSFKNFKFI